jgi:hypothetical protein
LKATERRELILRIIDLCESVTKKGLNPFDVQVRELFDKLRELLPLLKKHEELYLDLQAVLGLSEVIYQQGEWVKHRSSLLYLDPLLVFLKIHALSTEELAEVFAKSWHPVLEAECLTPHGIKEGYEYWRLLPRLDERLRGLEVDRIEFGPMERGELERMGFLSRELFESMLNQLWEELKQRGKVSYWDFVKGKSYAETVRRAYLLSFLITYGMASVEIDPLKEEIKVQAREKPAKRKAEVYSLPIHIPRSLHGRD